MSATTRKISRQNGGFSLSLCMIVKNESETLEQCLSTARPHVDEVVIVDTGSTDGTQAIAKRYADVFDEIEWPDSFAIARNHSLGLATGDYIIILDGDEFLPDPMHWRRIRKAIASGNVAAVKILVRNLLPEGQILAADRMWQERVYKNDPRIRYTGRVHNQLYDGLKTYVAATGATVLRANAEIIHTGYSHSSDRMREKYTVRIALLKAEIASAKDPVYRAYYVYQLGVVHYVLEEFETALDCYGSLEYQHLSNENAFYAHLLASQAALKAGVPTRSLVHCNGMLTLDRQEPIAYYVTGLALLQAHQLNDGMLMLLEAFQLNTRVDGLRFLLNPGELLGMLATICRGAGLQQHSEAFLRLKQADEFDPQAAAAVVSSLKLGLVRAERLAASA